MAGYRVQLTSDRDLLIAAFLVCTFAYFGLSLVLRNNSQVPLLVVVFLGSNMFSRTNLFRQLIGRFDTLSSKYGTDLGSGVSIPHTRGAGYGKFEALSETAKVELLTSIKSLQAYAVNSKKANDRRKKLFKLMSWRQQKLTEDAGYLKKLSKIDQSISKNQLLLNDIADAAISKYGISYLDFNLLKTTTQASTNTSSTNYRVIESIGHYIRDWSPLGEPELSPMLAYIQKQLDAVVPASERLETCIVLPGSGLGRVAHEIALKGEYGAVHAVEFSGLMHICNEYIYAKGNEKEKVSRDLFPYIHSCSNYLSTASQFRTVQLDTASQPASLTLNYGDFRYFSIPNREQYKNVVVVSIFFIDTAENLIEYFDKINALTAPAKGSVQNGFWINIGPLKYGSAAQAELNAEEIALLRAKMGWKDVDAVNTIETPSAINNIPLPSGPSPGLVGYITDKGSMWQGFYGLNMWASQRNENARLCK